MKNREEWLVDQLDNNEKLTPEVRSKMEAELDVIANRLTAAKTKAKIDTEFRKIEEQRAILEALVEREKALAKDMNLDYESWLALARSLYTITDNYEVVSVARGANSSQVWSEGSEYHARERIYKLIQYKAYDHFVRGCNFKHVPSAKKAAS